MWTIRRILCPTDFSACARTALDHCVGLSKQLHAEIVLLHVVPETAFALRSLGTFAVLPEVKAKVLDAAKNELQSLQAEVGAGIPVRTELREGQVHTSILDAAKAANADVIVIGTHGHTGLAHALLGSVAERVVRLSPIPVLTVRSAK